jgi:hypothetical protein
MSLPDDAVRAKDGETGKTDFADGGFLHTHYAGMAKSAAVCAFCFRVPARLDEPVAFAATSKSTDDSEFNSLQCFFAPLRARTDTNTAHGTGRTMTHNFAGNGDSARNKFSCARIKNDVAHTRSRRDPLSGDHHHFPTFQNCQQFRNGCAADLTGATENHCGRTRHNWTYVFPETYYPSRTWRYANSDAIYTMIGPDGTPALGGSKCAAQNQN